MGFTPKYRREPFTGEILRRCEELMRAVCADFESELVELNGDTDHVHLLVHYPPKVSLSRLVGNLKGVSARRLRQEFPDHIRKYLWVGPLLAPSYFAASCGEAPPSVIKDYIEQQKRPTWPAPQDSPEKRFLMGVNARGSSLVPHQATFVLSR